MLTTFTAQLTSPTKTWNKTARQQSDGRTVPNKIGFQGVTVKKEIVLILQSVLAYLLWLLFHNRLSKLRLTCYTSF